MGRGAGVRAVGPEAVQVDFRWKGERCRERLRLKPTPANLKWAAGLKARIEHEIATGQFVYAHHFPDSPRAAQSAGARLSHALAGYINGIAKAVQPETVREYRQHADTLVEGIGDPHLSNLTRAQVRNWVASSPLSKKRIDNILIPLRGCLSQGIEDGLLSKNVLDGFTVERNGMGRRAEIDPFTPDEIEALGQASNGDLWTFWAWTGLRSGEVIGLRWGDVDRDGAAVRVQRAVRLGREKAPKTQAGTRSLALLLPARECIESRRIREPAGGDPVWTNPNTGSDWHEAKALARAFRKACSEANVRYRYVYQLRHSFASRALSSGENPLWVAKYMGHTNVAQIFRHYGKWIPASDPLAGSRMLPSPPKSKAA
jgi:integrase